MSEAKSESRWEQNVYSKGRHLNLYPTEMIVSFVFSHVAKLGEAKDLRVLDLGCGAGNNVWFLVNEGFSVAGIDESVSAIEFGRKRLEDAGLGADLRVGDFAQLDWDDESFDVVIDRGAITCNRRADIERTLSEVKRVLRPGGLFFSQMISWEHGSRQFGEDLGDGCYDNFSNGYYAGISRIFFADSDAIDALYDSEGFDIVSKEHATVEPEDPAGKKAHWRVICRRT